LKFSAADACFKRLFEASRSGDLDKVKEVLEVTPAWINKGDGADWTALHFSAWNNHPHVVEWLCLEGGANIDQKKYLGQTALMQASYGGHKKVLQTLLDCKASTTVSCDGGHSCLWYAIVKNQPECAKMLMDAGASWFTQEGEGMPAWAVTYVAERKQRRERCAVAVIQFRHVSRPIIGRDVALIISKMLWSSKEDRKWNYSVE
jgi:uncharacterized protein